MSSIVVLSEDNNLYSCVLRIPIHKKKLINNIVTVLCVSLLSAFYPFNCEGGVGGRLFFNIGAVQSALICMKVI